MLVECLFLLDTLVTMSFWHAGQTFSLFCCGMTFVMSGMGGETCAHPLQNKGVSFWECWNEPNTVEAYDFLKKMREMLKFLTWC